MIANKPLLLKEGCISKVTGSLHHKSETAHALRVQAQKVASYSHDPEDFIRRAKKLAEGHQFTLKHIEDLVLDFEIAVGCLQREIKEHREMLAKDKVPYNALVVGDQRTQWEHCLRNRIEQEENAQEVLGLLQKLQERWELVEYATRAEIPDLSMRKEEQNVVDSD